jgi:hypothetical protein
MLERIISLINYEGVRDFRLGRLICCWERCSVDQAVVAAITPDPALFAEGKVELIPPVRWDDLAVLFSELGDVDPTFEIEGVKFFSLGESPNYLPVGFVIQLIPLH